VMQAASGEVMHHAPQTQHYTRAHKTN